MRGDVELRHLRYFVAVAEAESLTVAAKMKLHTSQPSLSRQIRDLEEEVGAQLLTRGARGIELTPAGRAFADHARLVLSAGLRASTSIRVRSESPWRSMVWPDEPPGVQLRPPLHPPTAPNEPCQRSD